MHGGHRGEGFDAGIRYGGRVPEDFVALPLDSPLAWIMVASPTYLERNGEPKVLDDLQHHRCIGMRTGTGAIYHWELEKGGIARTMDLKWSVIVSESTLAGRHRDQ